MHAALVRISSELHLKRNWYSQMGEETRDYLQKSAECPIHYYQGHLLKSCNRDP